MCDLSIVVPTFNRADSVGKLLLSLMAQDCAGLDFEVLVVDNNSTDGTREVVLDYAAADRRIKYFFEPRRGVSYARNTGIVNAAAGIIAFVDDDIEARPDWARLMRRAFDEHPDVDCVGGRVRPVWTSAPPSWLTAAHVGAIAVQDRPDPFTVGRHNASPCLLTANFACRRTVFEDVGLFSPTFRRGQDREIQMRMWRAGKRGIYRPDIEVTVEPPAERLTKAYHRRWQATTARYHALMWYVDTVSADNRLVPVPPERRTFLGTPLFLYREFLGYAAGWAAAALTFDGDRRFHYGARLCYAASFVVTRWRQHRAGITGPLSDAPRIEPARVTATQPAVAHTPELTGARSFSQA